MRVISLRNMRSSPEDWCSEIQQSIKARRRRHRQCILCATNAVTALMFCSSFSHGCLMLSVQDIVTDIKLCTREVRKYRVKLKKNGLNKAVILEQNYLNCNKTGEVMERPDLRYHHTIIHKSLIQFI